MLFPCFALNAIFSIEDDGRATVSGHRLRRGRQVREFPPGSLGIAAITSGYQNGRTSGAQYDLAALGGDRPGVRQERAPISSKASFGNPLFAQAWRRAGTAEIDAMVDLPLPISKLHTRIVIAALISRDVEIDIGIGLDRLPFHEVGFPAGQPAWRDLHNNHRVARSIDDLSRIGRRRRHDYDRNRPNDHAGKSVRIPYEHRVPHWPDELKNRPTFKPNSTRRRNIWRSAAAV